MTPTLHHTPRRHLVYRATQPGRPLIIAGGGLSQRIDPPGTRAISWGQWNANFVEESRLLNLAERRNVSVCFVDSAPPAPWWRRTRWWRRNWSAADIPDLVAITRKVQAEVQAPHEQTFPWGLSDFATLTHELAAELDLPAVVAHSGLVPTRLARACLLVCGSEDRAPGVWTAQAEIERLYHGANRQVRRWTVDGGHEWAWAYNDEMLIWCERFAENYRSY